MPIYEFECQRCDERFELRRPMRDADAPARCSAGHPDVTRRVATFAVRVAATSPVEGCGAGEACCGGACGPA